MDTIQFTSQLFVTREYWIKTDEEFDECHTEINIYINGRNLLDLVQQVERAALESESPFYRSDGSQRSYAGLNPEWYSDLRDEFLGKTANPYSVVLTCTCYQDGCNSVRVKIDAGPEVITWRDFTSVLHGEECRTWGGTPVDYSSLGPFVFDRKQYLRALNVLGLSD